MTGEIADVLRLKHGLRTQNTGSKFKNLILRVFLGLSLVLAGLTVNATAYLHSQEEPELRPLPNIRLQGLEPKVREQLESIVTELEEVLRDPAVRPVERAEAFGNFGQLLHAYEMYEAAADCYQNARVLAPSDFRWAYYLGVILKIQGRGTEAMQAFETALEFQPDSIPTLIQLGEISLESRLLEQAEKYFSKAASLKDSEGSAHYGLGQVELSRRNYDSALGHLQAALERAPEVNSIHYSLGIAFRGTGDLEAAQFHLSRGGPIGVRPSDPLLDELQNLATGEIYSLLRGRRAFHVGRYEEAVAEFRRAVAAAPKSSRSRTNLASALAMSGKVDEAMLEFRKAIDLDPSGADTARINLARLLIHQVRAAEAVPLLRAALSRRPSDHETRFQLARALGLVGDYGTALGIIRPAVEAWPPDLESSLLEVDLLSRLNRWQTARERLEGLRQKLPLESRVVQRLAILLATAPDPGVRDLNFALTVALEAFELSPTVEYAETVVFVHIELADCQSPVRWLKSIIETTPAREVRTQFEELLVAVESDSPCSKEARRRRGGEGDRSLLSAVSGSINRSTRHSPAVPPQIFP